MSGVPEGFRIWEFDTPAHGRTHLAPLESVGGRDDRTLCGRRLFLHGFPNDGSEFGAEVPYSCKQCLRALGRSS